MKLQLFTSLLLSVSLLTLPLAVEANQADSLRQMIQSRRQQKATESFWEEFHDAKYYSPKYIFPQHGSMDGDRVGALPGQPNGVDFNQYAGYVTVDPTAGRALFYYFVESPENSSTNPLVLWLNGGPGCSSLGYGAMEELGPFRVSADGKTLFKNPYAWNKVANVIFLESPAGVGFSYSNTSSDYTTGDTRTANDNYAFLVNWLERFPQYKLRDFFITGESYAGHYVPQLAMTILANNQNTNQTVINLKGVAIGNAYIDAGPKYLEGIYDYYWTHALISDETHNAIVKHCDFVNWTYSRICGDYLDIAKADAADIDHNNIYAPRCHDPAENKGVPSSIDNFDPCSDNYVHSYLNTPEVQTAFHARPTSWESCNQVVFDNWTDNPITVLPVIKTLMTSSIRVWLYSGDTDAVVPVTTSRYAIDTYKLPIKTPWHQWYTNLEVGGYVEEYEGLTFATVRGAGHPVPSYQPERALVMFSSFLQGSFPPPPKA
ncbi:hypothetical protein SLEP1_g56649 [Rubroshorea leprosula]|uniref:Carboxypeptidase n=1 Tax=Rubroshorea leprosula TaxID=152421 RepID=A0AAV5MMV0_9ROSI|nr:hypothetical protein SLEP1_g56649 [Rubroshorea leprosula]